MVLSLLMPHRRKIYKSARFRRLLDIYVNISRLKRLEEDVKNVESEKMLRSVAYCEARIIEINQTLQSQVANSERPDKKLKELVKVCNRVKAQIEMGC